MPIQNRWLDDQQTILLIDFIEPDLESWDEYHTQIDAAWAMTHSIEHPVVLIVNSGERNMPALNPLPHLLRSYRSLPHCILHIIVVVDNRFTQIILEMLQRIHLITNIEIALFIDEAIQKAQNYTHNPHLSTR